MMRLRALALALFPLAAGCSDVLSPGSGLTELAAARQRWNGQNLQSYSFTLQRSCFCVNVQPLRVTVIGDAVVSVVDPATNKPVDLRSGETIDGLFRFIENAIATKAAVLEVRYDAVAGFPTHINFDGSFRVADDELTYTASNVTRD
jgi:hypothetical protein